MLIYAFCKIGECKNVFDRDFTSWSYELFFFSLPFIYFFISGLLSSFYIWAFYFIISNNLFYFHFQFFFDSIAVNHLGFFSSYFSGMDESISTVLTILCNHTFHSQCLAQWEDASCPVCRHVQTPEQVAEQKCFECQGSEDLWICLICGYVRTHHMFSRILKFLSVIVF